jgi:hypothetical protein
MSGYSRIYVVGEPDGLSASDSVNPVRLMLLVGDADRQWLEPHYVDATLAPLGNVRSLVPREPDDPDSIIDACIAFAPALFAQCPTLPRVRAELGDRVLLDFHLSEDGAPDSWAALREEARPIFRELRVWKAVQEPGGSPWKSYRDLS